MFGMSRDSEIAAVPSYGASSPAPTFMPQPIAESDIPTERSDWIGGEEYDQTRLYYTGPRITGQARPRL